MIEFADTFPDADVQPGEYQRLLGYPPEWVMEGRARELADWARAWYAGNGRPWVYARQASSVGFGNSGGVPGVLIDGVRFASPRLENTLRHASADGAVLVAASAGCEVDTETHKLWRGEKPDEYFFLEMYGSAVVEHLVTAAGARLCAWAETRGMAVLPHYSPGYPEWDIAEQPGLLALLRGNGAQALPGELEALESGMLRPKKSLLAVFGLTRDTERVRRLTELVPCENCSFGPCQFRRAPYRRLAAYTNGANGANGKFAAPVPALDRDAEYKVNIKALARWANERLSLDIAKDGAVNATFRYDGTTCSNMGRPLMFLYRVNLGPGEQGYPILDEACSPAPGDTGHEHMCRNLDGNGTWMAAIESEKPLLGRPLNDVLTWQRSVAGAGCYCEPESREHKWGLVLETIHYALAQRQ